MTPTKRPRDFKDRIEVVFKHKKKVLAISLLGVFITLTVAHIQTPYYDVRSVVMVKYGRQYVPTGEAEESKYPSILPDAIVNTEVLILTSRDLLSSVVSAIGPKALYPNLPSNLKGPEIIEAATAKFQDDFAAKAVSGSNAVEITYHHKDRQIARRAVAELLNALVEKHLKVFSDSKSTFLEDQVKLYGEKMRESEEGLATFKMTHNITSLKDQYFYMVGKRTEIESALKIEESRLTEIKEKLSFLKTQKRKVVDDLYANDARKTLTDLQAKEALMLQTYKKSSLPVRNVTKQIDTIQKALHKYEEENKASGEWVAVEAEMKPQQIKINSMREQVTGFDRQLQGLASAEDEMNKLEHEVSLNRVNYETYLKRYEEARISDDMDKRKLTNISIIEAPTVSSSPKKLSTSKILGVGLVLSPMLALALAFLLEGTNQRVAAPENARNLLGMRVLVTVPHKV